MSIPQPGPARPGDEIAAFLAEEAKELAGFVELLRQEQALLESGNIDPLPALAVQKAMVADQLTATSARREQALIEGGFSSGRDAVVRWLAADAGKDQARDNWHRLLDLLATARTLNETNGKLIAVRMQHNQQALATLMSAADRLATYGPDGQQKTTGSGRSLGSA